MMADSIKLEELKEYLHYSPDTGIFTWIKRKGRGLIGNVSGNVNVKSGYWTIFFKGKRYYAHRLAWFYMTGEWPEVEIDHKNRIKDDNRFCNLRLATLSENRGNVDLLVTNTSGCRGVYWNRGKWCARIWKNDKHIWLGRFKTKQEAAKAYNTAALNHFGEFAKLNEIT